MWEGWILRWYREDEGREPLVRTFLNDRRLRKDEKAKLKERIRLLSIEGIALARDLPTVLVQLKGAHYRRIYELRVTRTPSNPRTFLFFTDQREIVLLFGVRKVGSGSKSMKRHYERAVRLRDKWLKRRGDND